MQFINEMRAAGETIWDSRLPQPLQSASEFVAGVLEAETKAKPGLVTETTYWSTVENEVVGLISFRHVLNENLKEFGGHIGYEVKPSQRRKGYATKMLGLLLQTPRAKQIGKLLLTCAPNNIASNKTIVANGGVLTDTKFVDRINRDTNYYWITIQ